MTRNKRFFFESYVIKRRYLSEYYIKRTEEYKLKNLDTKNLKISEKLWFVKTHETPNQNVIKFCRLTSEDILTGNAYNKYYNNASEQFSDFKPDELKWLSRRCYPLSKFILLLKVNNVAITIYTSVTIAFLINLLLYN